eukprot:1959935-Pyramimonas_sp.AAC.1
MSHLREGAIERREGRERHHHLERRRRRPTPAEQLQRRRLGRVTRENRRSGQTAQQAVHQRTRRVYHPREGRADVALGTEQPIDRPEPASGGRITRERGRGAADVAAAGTAGPAVPPAAANQDAPPVGAALRQPIGGQPPERPCPASDDTRGIRPVVPAAAHHPRC